MEDTVAFVARLSTLHRGFDADGRRILKRIVKTCHEMLTDRGCRTISVSPDPAQSAVNGEAVLKGETVWVYFHHEERVGVKFVRALLEESEREGVKVVCLSIDGPTPFTKKECDGKLIQFLSMATMCNNVTKHFLVPKHVPLFEYSKEDSANLPKIFDTDAVVQYYDWPVGTVVRVERVFGGHEPIPYLRVVCTASS